MSDTLPNSESASGSSAQKSTLWRHADFMKLWIGQLISLSGSTLTRLAVQLLAAITLNATPTQMGFLAAASTIPSLIIGLFSGVWIDKYRRRTVLIVCDIGRALILATIPAAVVLGVLSMTQLYIVTFLGGIFTVFFEVASQSYLPIILDPGQLVEGNSKLGLASSITSVAGISLAGVVIQLITAPLAIIVDMFSFLASAYSVFLIRKPEPPPQQQQGSTHALIREGLAVVIRNPLIRALAGCLATSNFASNMFFALYALFGTRVLGLDAAALGLVYGIGASGAIMGAVLAPMIAARFGIGRAIIGGALLGSLEVLPIIFAIPHTALPLLLLSSMAGNFGWVLFGINATSLRQAITPVALQGRTNATLNFLVAGMLPLGALLGGYLGQAFDLRETIGLAALGSLLSALWVLLSPVRSLKRIPAVV